MTDSGDLLDFLLTLDEPWVSYVVAPRMDVWSHVGHSARPDEVDVRFLHAKRMTTATALWDEFEAVLQWPTYFGRNWMAFHDFMSDLYWIEARAYAFVVFDADRLLEDQPPSDRRKPANYLAAFVSDCGRYAESFRVPRRQSWSETRPVTPYHVILHVEPDNASRFLARLDQAGVELPRAPFEIPAPAPTRAFTAEELVLLADYIQDHDGLSPWGEEGTPMNPDVRRG